MWLFDWEVFLPVQMCGVMLSGSEESTPSIVYHCVLRGLERLLLSEQLSRLDAESLVKLSVDRVNVHSPHRAMAALGLMLTCMYTGEQGATCARRVSAAELRTHRTQTTGPSSSQGCRAVQVSEPRLGARLQTDPWALCGWAGPWGAGGSRHLVSDHL